MVTAHAAVAVGAKMARTKKAWKKDKVEFKSPIQKRAHWLLHQFWFDAFLGMMIMFNLVIVIVETDAGARNQDPPPWTNIGSRILIVVFTADILLQLYVQRLAYWCDGMNIFDFVVVFTDVCMNVVELIAGPVLSVSILRIVRLCKLARVAQAFKIFSELRLLLAGLIGSVKAIFWGTVLLVLSLTIWAIIAVQFLHPLNEKLAAEGRYEDCERCARVYSTVFDAFLVFFQQIVAGDSWGMVSVTMIEEHPLTLFIYGPLFLSVGLAVLNLMLGVVVDVASQARGHLLGLLEEESTMTKMELKHKLLDLCEALDGDGNGYLDKEELKKGFQDNPDFRESLTGMNITEDDLDILWTILDEERTGLVSYQSFCGYCYKMRASKEEFMLTYIKYYVTVIKAEICEEIELVKEEMLKQDKQAAIMEQRIYQEEQIIEQQIDEQTRHIEKAILKSERQIEDQIDQNALQLEVGTSPRAPCESGKGVDALSDGMLNNAKRKGVEEKARKGSPRSKDFGSDFHHHHHHILAEVAESMNLRQAELLAAIESMKNKLDHTFDKLLAPESSVLTAPRKGYPNNLVCRTSL